MGFFKNINANVDFDALERYIKNEEWEINNSSNSNRFSSYYDCAWEDLFYTAYDAPWYFTLVNGIYMIDSRVLFGGATYHNIHALGDYTGVLFQAMIDKKPIRIIAGVKYVDKRHIDIKLIFDINNGARQITIYETRRKIKNWDTGKMGAVWDSNYNFNQNYKRQQQKLAKRYAGRNRW